MDENMPKLDGVSATKEIRKIEISQGIPRTPIVALTASALKGDKERLLEAGMANYITKPIEPKRLLATIGETLRDKAK
jgi:CheY-like chemotaxis protein